jgi:hypothetical protein
MSLDTRSSSPDIRSFRHDGVPLKTTFKEEADDATTYGFMRKRVRRCHCHQSLNHSPWVSASIWLYSSGRMKSKRNSECDRGTKSADRRVLMRQQKEALISQVTTSTVVLPDIRRYRCSRSIKGRVHNQSGREGGLNS